MRIALDYQAFWWQTYGGISRYFVRLAQCYVAGGQEVGVFAPIHRNDHIRELPRSVVHGYRVDRIPSISIPVLVAYNKLMATRGMRAWKPDIVHETYYTDGIFYTPKDCPTVVTVHDMIHELFSNEISKRDRTSQWKRDAVARADHVICVSENTRRDLIRLFETPESKVSVVYHGFENGDDRRVEQGNERSKAEKPYLLYVGNRGGYKNFSGLLKAVSISRHLKSDFDIIAFGGGPFCREESDLIRRLGFQPTQVRQLAGGDEVLGRAYDSASAFVYPSLYEGFGLPPLEAMAHHCPVVSSNTSSMPEVIGDAAEYFDPSLEQSMAQAIEKVVYVNEYAEALVQRGVERLRLYSWQRCATDTLSVYRKLLGQ